MQKYFIRTYGCQMNELDSSVMAGILEKKGLVKTSIENDADIIIFNTCSIRDLAERKVLGKIGILSRKKKKAIIGIAGCMSSLKKEKLLEKFSNIDFVLGTNNISDLEKIIDNLNINKQKICRVDDVNKSFEISPLIAKHPSSISAYVSIIRGCNNFCSYCVVPYSRGREISRKPIAIVDECKYLADKGFKEITLLGQNVNSYGLDLKKENIKISFDKLLYELDKIPGIERIRFLTSHPKDITKELMYAIRDLPSVCNFLHLPLQSGSDNVLYKMNRKYTKKDYLEKIYMLKELVPNISFGTDIIVGFPGETEDDFIDTIKLFEEVKYSTAYIFAFSPRKNTPAASMKNAVSLKEKQKRLQILLNLYDKILNIESKKFINQSYDVLVERKNKNKKMLKGKTNDFKKVIFEGPDELLGKIVNIKLINFKNHTYIGKLNN